MSRQRVRKALILFSFLLFPITIYYLSPVLIVFGAAQGVAAGSFIVFSLLFAGALFLGRLFCGWICPAAGLQEICFMVNDKQARGGKGDWIKYLLWAPWVLVIALLFIRAGGVREIDPFYHTLYGISVAQPGDYIIYYGVVGLIILLAVTLGKRAFCHYGCWMAPFTIIGTKISAFGRWPALRLSANPLACNRCLRCNEVCTMGLDVEKMVRRETPFHSECVLCGACVDNCPRNVLAYSFTFLRKERTAAAAGSRAQRAD